MDVTIYKCSLFWKVDESEIGKFVFLVALKDRNGMFYHVGTLAENKIDLPPAIINKAEQFIILKIGENGIRSRHESMVK